MNKRTMTPAAIAANRANARKSTGPTSSGNWTACSASSRPCESLPHHDPGVAGTVRRSLPHRGGEGPLLQPVKFGRNEPIRSTSVRNHRPDLAKKCRNEPKSAAQCQPVTVPQTVQPEPAGTTIQRRASKKIGNEPKSGRPHQAIELRPRSPTTSQNVHPH